MARRMIVPLVTGLALLGGMPPAKAAETFLCSDGRILQVTSANRGQLKDDPCVANWFGKEREQWAAQQDAAQENTPNRVVTKKGHEPRYHRPSTANDMMIILLTDPRRR